MSGRPLLSIDLEATGVRTGQDRIVQIGIASDSFEYCELVNPECPIPPGATECHKITDAMVAGAPTFSAIASDIHEIIRDCDLVGFNLLAFDVPMLWEELFRAGIEWDLTKTKIIDVGVLFKKREPRTLSEAVKRYCGGKVLDGAHDALVDARATLDVLAGMRTAYPDMVAATVEQLARESEYEQKRLDLDGKIIVGPDGRPTYNIGKAKGTAVVDDPGFGRWMLSKDFSENTKRVLRGILDAPVAVVDSGDEIPF